MIYNRCLNAATSQQVYSLLGLLYFHLGQLSSALALVYQNCIMQRSFESMFMTWRKVLFVYHRLGWQFSSFPVI